MKTTLAREAKIYLAIALELIFGFLTGLLILGLVPADGVDFNVVGSLVLAVPCAAVYWAAHRYRNVREPSRT